MLATELEKGKIVILVNIKHTKERWFPSLWNSFCYAIYKTVSISLINIRYVVLSCYQIKIQHIIERNNIICFLKYSIICISNSFKLDILPNNQCELISTVIQCFTWFSAFSKYRQFIFIHQCSEKRNKKIKQLYQIIIKLQFM